MKSRIKDERGKRYGRLMVTGFAMVAEDGQAKWLCTCDCGNVATVKGSLLRKGQTVSCGCYAKEQARKRGVKRLTTHGLSRDKLHRMWYQMIQRCTNPNNDGFACYGARGITVSERWMVFENFLEDMGTPAEGLSIERINNSSGYCKENCKWADRQEQARNTRRNVIIEYLGQKKPIAVWADELGIPYWKIQQRLKRGWTPERTFK
jgi:hypothetical protein